MRNLHLTFDWHYVGQRRVKILQNFMAFTEYMNFNHLLPELDMQEFDLDDIVKVALHHYRCRSDIFITFPNLQKRCQIPLRKVLSGVIWHLIWVIGFKVKNFLRLSYL